MCNWKHLFHIPLYTWCTSLCTPSFAKKATVDCLLGTKKRCTHCMVPTVHKITCHRESAMHGHHPWLWPCGPRDEQSGRALRNTTGYCSRRARSFAWRVQERFHQFMDMKGLSPHQCHDHGQQTDELDQGIHTRRMPGLQHWKTGNSDPFKDQFDRSISKNNNRVRKPETVWNKERCCWTWPEGRSTSSLLLFIGPSKVPLCGTAVNWNNFIQISWTTMGLKKQLLPGRWSNKKKRWLYIFKSDSTIARQRHQSKFNGNRSHCRAEMGACMV